MTKLSPDNWEAWYNLAFACQKNDAVDEAVQAYSEAVLLKSDAAQAHANLALLLHERGNTGVAKVEYLRALECDPAAAGTLWNLSLLCERDSDFAGAAEYLARLAELKPDWEDASFRLGFIRLQQEMFEPAAEAFANCVRRKKKWAEAWLNLGIAQWRSGLRDKAGDAFRSALECNPSFVPALIALCSLALEQSDYVEALDTLNKLDELGEKAPELAFNLGLLLHKEGLDDEAAKAFRRAAGWKEGFGEALLNLGNTLNAIGQTEEARACWQQAVEAKPDLAPLFAY